MHNLPRALGVPGAAARAAPALRPRALVRPSALTFSETCFLHYHQKTRKERCPACQQPIHSYLVHNALTNSESAPLPFHELLSSQTGPLEETGSAFDCLDHSYFNQEIANLVALRCEIEQDKFHRRLLNREP